jgi:hypothetical protein
MKAVWGLRTFFHDTVQDLQDRGKRPSRAGKWALLAAMAGAIHDRPPRIAAPQATDGCFTNSFSVRPSPVTALAVQNRQRHTPDSTVSQWRHRGNRPSSRPGRTGSSRRDWNSGVGAPSTADRQREPAPCLSHEPGSARARQAVADRRRSAQAERFLHQQTIRVRSLWAFSHPFPTAIPRPGKRQGIRMDSDR